MLENEEKKKSIRPEDILGFSYRDDVTSFDGIASEVSYSICGQIKVLIVSENTGNYDVTNSIWFNFNRLVFLPSEERKVLNYQNVMGLNLKNPQHED